MIKHELDTVQQVKEEIEELREYVDRLEEHTQRRKLRLLEQVIQPYRNRMPFVFYDFLQYIFMIFNKKILSFFTSRFFPSLSLFLFVYLKYFIMKRHFVVIFIR